MANKETVLHPKFVPSTRLIHAFQMASEWHAQQVRKSTTIPYLSHLMGVASLVMEHGGDEDQTIASLLHDAVEDIGSVLTPIITVQFGQRVADIVLGCTDSIAELNGQKPDWKVRKKKYLRHLQETHADVLLVSACDKLHNARAIVTDLDSLGVKMFERFNSKPDQILWYYRSLAEVFDARMPDTSLVRELKATVDRMDRLSSSGRNESAFA